jgi:polysaccharide biosynthesis transport protein
MSLPSPYYTFSSAPDAPYSSPLLISEQPNHSGPTLRQYVHVLRRHWRMVVLPCIAALGITGVILLLITPTYTARSTILIERQAPQVLDVKQPVSEETDEEHDFYETQYELLASRRLAADVIVELGLAKYPFLTVKPAHRSVGFLMGGADGPKDKSSDHSAGIGGQEMGVDPRVIDGYLNHLKIIPAPRTRLVTVAFSSPDPVLSARIVAAHVRAYIARGTQLRAEASKNAEEFLQGKLADLEKRVERSEAALNNYRRDRGIVGSATDDKTKLVMNRIIDLNKALTAAETQRIALDAQARLTRAHDYNSLPEIQNSRVIQMLKTEQSNVDSQYASMASQYRADYPPLTELAAKRASLQKRLDQEMKRIAAGVEWKFTAAVEREQEMRQEIDAEKKEAAALNDASLQDTILSRELAGNRELYKSVLTRMNEMGMAAGVSASNVSVVDSAEVPLVPSSPQTVISLTLVGMLALFCGVSGAFLLDHFEDSFENPDEIEKSLRLPSLGAVPNFRELTRTNHKLLRHSPARLPVSLAQLPDDGEITQGICSFAAAGEAYRAIRISILLSKAEAPPKSILITSGSPQEGKTVTAINLAIAFAKMGSRVLLIDGDLRRSRCHEILGLGRRAGLTEVLTGSGSAEELIVPTGVERLWCLTAGSRPPNPWELLGSAKMAYTILCLRDLYDFIIVDSAPVMPVTDTLPLTAVVDGVLMVVGPHTPKEQVRKASARLCQIRTNVLGVILNQTEVSESDYYYSRASLEYVDAASEATG